FGRLQREDVTVSFVATRGIEAALELDSLPGVLRVEPFRVLPVRLTHEHRSKRTGLIGMQETPDLRRLVDESAQTFSLPPDGIVLTNHLAKMLGAEPGDLLTVEVLDESRPNVQIPLAATMDELIGVSAYMRLDAVNRMMHEGPAISGAYLLVDDDRLDDLYRRLKNTPAVAGVASRDVMLQSFMDTIAEMMSIINTFVIVFAVIIAMGVVYNGARIALSERGRELASLRVLGFTRTEVGAMLLGEQAILTTIAIPFGYVIGYFLSAWLAAQFQTDLYRFPLVISRQTWALAFVVVAVAAVISAFLVQRRIGHLDLVEVLKTRE
ncbi:MAG TPA: ABC transporter permease, partial [Thermoanaerobaculia bacterium]|nr:ABC transporter permease [Thermoanaerobaculia bacterium]